MDAWRIRAAWALLVGSTVLWPVSHFTFAKTESPVTLALSWFAIVLVAADLLSTQKLNQKQNSKDTP